MICSINEDTLPTIKRSESYTSTVSWDKARSDGKISHYPFALSQNLWSLKFPTTSMRDEIECYYNDILDAIRKAEKDTLPYKQFKPYMKPYWNDTYETT